MKNKIIKTCLLILPIVFFVCIHSTSAAEKRRILSNEVDEKNANTTIFDFDNSGGEIILQFGRTLNEKILWNELAEKFIITDDLNVELNIDVDGVIFAGSGDVSITNADGTLDGSDIAIDSIGDTSINFGVDPGQVGADDILVVDEFNTSNSANVQDVLDDVDNAIGDRVYTEENFINNSETISNSLDALDQQVQDNTNTILGLGGGSINGTTNNTFTLDSDDSGGSVELVFGTTINAIIEHDGSIFHFNDDIQIDADGKIQFRDDFIHISSSADSVLNISADGEVDVTTPLLDVNGNVDISGTLNGVNISTTELDFQGNTTIGTNNDTLALESSNWTLNSSGEFAGVSFDANSNGNTLSNVESGNITNNTLQDEDINTNANISFTKLATREKTLQVIMAEPVLHADGTNNLVNVYFDAEDGDDPHYFYIVNTLQPVLQDIELQWKVLLPEDFVSFANANDISFFFKNTGIDSNDSRIDILVEDEDGDDAFLAEDGEGLFNVNFTEYLDEFDGGNFDPITGEYIYITIKGYASFDAVNHSPSIGEVVIRYTGR